MDVPESVSPLQRAVGFSGDFRKTKGSGALECTTAAPPNVGTSAFVAFSLRGAMVVGTFSEMHHLDDRGRSSDGPSRLRSKRLAESDLKYRVLAPTLVPLASWRARRVAAVS